MMVVLPGNASHIGQRREQQDAFALSDFADAEFVAHGGYLALVADGIGGLFNGKQAAERAVAGFMATYLAKPRQQTIDQTLDLALKAANQAVIAQALDNDVAEQMGTTLVAAVVHSGLLYWRAVGDSHLYLCRDGRLSQLNAEHTLARHLQAQVDQGLLSQTAADHHPARNALDSFIGMRELLDIERNRQPLALQPGDQLLLCSDGIDGSLSADEIIACLNARPMLAAHQLCRAVLSKQQPAQDNLTAVVLAYHETSRLQHEWRKLTARLKRAVP